MCIMPDGKSPHPSSPMKVKKELQDAPLLSPPTEPMILQSMATVTLATRFTQKKI